MTEQAPKPAKYQFTWLTEHAPKHGKYQFIKFRRMTTKNIKEETNYVEVTLSNSKVSLKKKPKSIMKERKTAKMSYI